MAIRPTDIQGAIWQASQTAAVTQRAEEAPRAAQAAAQQSFAAHVQEREETVNETGEVLGNRVDAVAEPLGHLIDALLARLDVGGERRLRGLLRDARRLFGALRERCDLRRLRDRGLKVGRSNRHGAGEA